jgi:hypothetical protein
MTSPSRARTRSLEEMRDLGRKAAEVLSRGGFVNEAAHVIGVPIRTYREWLHGEDDAAVAFQAEVMPAYFSAAREAEEKAEQDIFGGEMHSSAAVTWHRFKTERRYPLALGEQASKIELSGANGGPIDVRDLSKAKDAELLSILDKTTKDTDAGE